jgi:hypothetical protein
MAIPTRPAPVSHPKRSKQDTTNDIKRDGNCWKINEPGRYPPAHNGLVAGSGIVARSRPPSRVETGTPSGRPPERYAIDPHAMHDNSELASDSNLRFLQSIAFDQAKAPRFDSGPFLYSCQQGTSGLE